jgi:hypothetical protein
MAFLKHPPSSDRNDEKKSSMADMSGLLPLDAAGYYSSVMVGSIRTCQPEQ